MEEKILEIKDLSVEYHIDKSIVKAVNGVSLSMNKGETLGLVGETGAGKTTIAKAIMQILPEPPSRITGGEIYLDGKEIISLPEKEKRSIRGNKVSMIFQDPMTALNPVEVVGKQIAESYIIHKKISKSEAMLKAGEMLEQVGIPAGRANDYPHQFSGGMKQRVIIAIALACNPDLIIADEPTTALDVTIQAQVLKMMSKLKDERNTSVLLITHDLGIVAGMCDKVAVVYAGEIVEWSTTREIYKHTSHPYTQGLFDSLPNLNIETSRLKPIDGKMPDPTDLPEGCAFHPRCPFADDVCRECHPEIREIREGHLVRCHHPLSKEG